MEAAIRQTQLLQYQAGGMVAFVEADNKDKLLSFGIQMIKLYPEGNAEARVKVRGVKRILFYCNRDGLFVVKL